MSSLPGDYSTNPSNDSTPVDTVRIPVDRLPRTVVQIWYMEDLVLNDVEVCAEQADHRAKENGVSSKY